MTTWTPAELRAEFDIIALCHPLASVRRRSDGMRGTLIYDRKPRLYRCFRTLAQHPYPDIDEQQ
jgi:hypothetical protein